MHYLNMNYEVIFDFLNKYNHITTKILPFVTISLRAFISPSNIAVVPPALSASVVTMILITFSVYI